jgi:phenylacetate-CoA ligase
MIELIRTLAAIPRVDAWAAHLHCPPSNWKEHHDARVRDIVRYAYNKTRFYRQLWDEAGARPRAIGGAADLKRLPIISRNAWRNAPDEQFQPAGAYWPSLWYSTGGTTGEPLRLPYTLPDDAAMTAGMLAVFRLNGVRWRDLFIRPRSAMPPITPKLRTVGRLVYLTSKLDPEAVIQVLNGGQFWFIRCLPWTVWRAAVHCRRQGMRLPRVRLLFAGGELLPATARRTIAAVSGANVVDHYGTGDFGHMAAECSHRKLHMFSRTVHFEIMVEERPAAPGEAGEVVVTSFVSHARPAVRVRTGDWAAWGEGPCPCGSPIPYLAYMAGRRADRILTPDGRTLFWPEFEHALLPLGDDLFGFQVEQVSAERLIIRLSLAEPAHSTTAIRRCLRALLSDALYDLELTDTFRMEKSGKTRPTIGLA